MKINLNKRILRSAKETENPPQVAEKGPKTAKRASRLERAQYTPSRLRPGKRRMSGREKLIVLLPALAAILAVGIVLFTVDKVSVYKIRDTAYQYYGGRTVRIESGAELRSGTDGTVFLKTGKQTTETTLPVYLENSRYRKPRSVSALEPPLLTEIIWLVLHSTSLKWTARLELFDPVV